DYYSIGGVGTRGKGGLGMSTGIGAGNGGKGNDGIAGIGTFGNGKGGKN
ncbi:hypothetical protein L195_g042735, partial [Trifolium pratense]